MVKNCKHDLLAKSRGDTEYECTNPDCQEEFIIMSD